MPRRTGTVEISADDLRRRVHALNWTFEQLALAAGINPKHLRDRVLRLGYCFPNTRARIEAALARCGSHGAGPGGFWPWAGSETAARGLAVIVGGPTIAMEIQRSGHGREVLQALLALAAVSAHHDPELHRQIASWASFVGETDQARASIDFLISALPEDRDALMRLGAWYRLRGDWDQAQSIYARVLDADDANGETQARAYGALGLIYRKRGALGEARVALVASLRVHRRLGQKWGIANALSNLGLLFATAGNIKSALKMHQEALGIEKRLGRVEGMVVDYGSLGLLHWRAGRLAAAATLVQKALSMSERAGYAEGMASQYSNLGVILQAQLDFADAARLHERALAANERLARQEGVAYAFGNLALAHAGQGKLEIAEVEGQKALELYRGLRSPEGVANSQAGMAIIRSRQGRLDDGRDLLAGARDGYRKLCMRHMCAQMNRLLSGASAPASLQLTTRFGRIARSR